MTNKELKVVQAKNGMFFAKYEGGGQLPADLSGLWTNENDLKKRIEKYLATRRDRSATTTKKPRTPAKKKVESDG